MTRMPLLLLMSLLIAGCWYDPEAGTRPIATVKEPEKPEKPLYQRLGGEKGIARIVDEWISRSLDNPRVNFTRHGTDVNWNDSEPGVARLKSAFVQFISAAAGGPSKYEGPEMQRVHQGMKITGGEFDAMKKDLKETLKNLKVGEKEQNDLFKVIESVRKDIVEVP